MVKRSSGSSPRVRGTHNAPDMSQRPGRIIPACAGNTQKGQFARLVWPDHPRVCGEHTRKRSERCKYTGSSPRVRGTPEWEEQHYTDTRIIPACAGNTMQTCSPRSTEPDHPRVCGEHPRETPRHLQSAGSSPRVRGTRDGGKLCHGVFRIIPACAGNTAPAHPPRRASPDHPRVCGEHFGGMARPFVIRGSSPRVRGTPPAQVEAAAKARIIPACAGNTRRCRCTDARRTDHPRVCGEHYNSDGDVTKARGSSPRVRGTLWTVRTRGMVKADHPRVCGEHEDCAVPCSLPRGSSPRVRGTLPGIGDRTGVERIIPACAGNTITRHI